MSSETKEKIAGFIKVKSELLDEYQEIQEKMRALFNDASLTEKQRKLAREFHKDDKISSIAYACPRVKLFYPIKYWSIKKSFIDPYNKYIERLQKISEHIRELDRVIFMKDPSNETVAAWVASQTTKVEVVIDWDYILGGCGDCY